MVRPFYSMYLYSKCIFIFYFCTEASPIFAKAHQPPATTSNKYPIVVGCVSFFIVALVIFVAVVLYKRKKAYGGFYILTLPPLPDYIKKLDPHTPLTEQTNKLPYDAEWEFPRNRLKFCKYTKFTKGKTKHFI